MEKDEANPLEALENLGMLYAYTYKIAGEDGILALFGDRLIALHQENALSNFFLYPTAGLPSGQICNYRLSSASSD